jgi:uncharacterized membrane protein
MPRRFRWLFLVVLVLLVAGVAGALLLVRPDLSDARDRVDATWTPLRQPLVTRYTALAGVDTAIKTAGGSGRTVIRDLDRTLAEWQRSANVPDARADAGNEATLANSLEALARRALANVTCKSCSDKLKTNKDITAAFAAFDQAVLPAAAITRYNAAVKDYESQREGTIHHFVAAILGFDARPRLVPGT